MSTLDTETDKMRILFVDDEPHVISGLRRLLMPLIHEWEMQFADGGEAALRLFHERPFDVVVSDIRMPGMDGAELFTELRQSYPTTARIALSGQIDRETTMKLAGPTHQFLAKPIAADALIGAIRRVCSMRKVLGNEKLLDITNRLESLPSLPTLYLELMREIRSPDSSLAKIGSIIEKDIGMSAKILQLVNSAFFGIPERVTGPSHAVAMLGLDTISSLILNVHIASEFKTTGIKDFSISNLWAHSLLTALCAKEIALLQGTGKPAADEAFMAGLLHDVGLLVLASSLPEDLQAACELSAREEIPLTDAETHILGSSHAEVGGYLLGIWGLPDPVVEAALFHSHPNRSSTTGFSALTAVHIANAASSFGARDEAAPDPGHAACVHERIDVDYLEHIDLLRLLPEWLAVCDVRRRDFKDFKEAG